MAAHITLGPDILGFDVVVIVHWLLPSVAAFSYFVSALVRFALGFRHSGSEGLARRVALCCMGIVCITYTLSSAGLLYFSLLGEPAVSRDSIAYNVNSAFIWFSMFLDLSGPRISSYASLAGCSIIYCLAEVFLLVPKTRHLELMGTAWAIAVFVVRGIRLLILSLLACVAVKSLVPLRRHQHGETVPLLGDDRTPRNNHLYRHGGSHYGAMSTGQTANLSNGTRQNGRPDSNSGKTMLLMPFVWPQNKPLLQLLCAVAGICLLVERALVLLVPLQLGRVVDALIEKPGTVPCHEIGIFVALWLLDTSGGIPMLCKCIWFPLEDNFYLRIGTAIFDKILTLPGDFHAKTNPANLWESVTRGVSVRYLVRSFVFHIIPTAVDISVAIVVLCYIFSIYMAMVFTAVVIVLFWVSYKMLPRLLGKQERLISDMENEHKCLYQATSNWQTTVYFNRIQHEKLRFRSAIANRMGSSASFSLGVHLECLARSCLLSGGLFGLYLLAAYQIAWGRKSLGSFVMLVFYWSRLSSHLQVLPSVIRDTTLGILNARELVARLSIEPSICNLKDAKPLLVDRGGVDFRDVGFTYAGQKQSLSHVDFQVEGGQTVAIVGESGSGKSSLSKLLLRMYDPAHGTIFIDGQNIQSVTLESLRDSVGVVPQEPAIFHDTIMNNVKYSNIFARDEQVYEACKVVGLHGLFMSFQEGYQTFLGEYGVSLSSGERQRMGIARIILRDPKILFLDEVMNNVDSNTESIVLQALKKLYMGRTIFIVSHRLSTIASADKILVFRRGRVVEQGDHNSLLAANGYYSCLWSHLARPKPPTSAVKVLGKKSQPAGTPLATREVNRIPLGRGEDPNDPVDLSMSNVGKWFLHKANERAKQKEISHLATGSPGGNFADVSPFQRTILKPDAPEFIPFAQRHSAESRDRHTGSCTNENQHTGTSEQFPEHNQVGKENMRQTPHPLTVRETLSPLVDGNVVSYTAHGGMSNDSTASVLQQVDNGVVLAYPRKARKRTRKSKRRAAVRRKLTESEPVEVGFGHEPYMLPT